MCSVEKLLYEAPIPFLQQNLHSCCLTPQDSRHFMALKWPSFGLIRKILHWVLKDHGGIAYFGFAYYSTNSATLTVARIAEDQVKGVTDSAKATDLRRSRCEVKTPPVTSRGVTRKGSSSGCVVSLNGRHIFQWDFCRVKTHEV